MDQAREENQQLKLTLSRMMKDYQSLKMQIHDIVKVQDDQPKISVDDESELVSLSLGRTSSGNVAKTKKRSNDWDNGTKLDGLELGLDCKFNTNNGPIKASKSPSKENSFDDNEPKEKENHKTAKSDQDGEMLQHNPLKKPRVSVRAVCDTQTMNDGCQWRKYGQKISKGNPCPRAYYRCTISSSCPVRKQVQRCMQDMSILTTTYEGTHDHPLPTSATTMASATTAAATMLNCGSTTSQPISQGVVSGATKPNNFPGFNFTNSNSSNLNFPRATIATSQSHPTVILDLTPPNHPSPQYNNAYTGVFSATRPSTTSFDFSSSTTPFTNALQLSRDNKFYSKNHLSATAPYNLSQLPYINQSNIQEQFVTSDNIAAATKAITHDPKFRSALTAVITSLMGNGGNNTDHESNSVQQYGKLNNQSFGLSFSQPSTRSGTSYLNKFPQAAVVLNSQQMMSLEDMITPFTLSASKSAVVASDHEGTQIKL